MTSRSRLRSVALTASVVWAASGCASEEFNPTAEAGTAGMAGSALTGTGGGIGGAETETGGRTASGGVTGNGGRSSAGGGREQGGEGGNAASGNSSAAGSSGEGGDISSAGTPSAGTAGSEEGGTGGTLSAGTAGTEEGGSAGTGGSTECTPGEVGCLLEQGEDCDADAQCTTQHCTDGVCCESACGETCARCDASGSEGSCVATANDDACNTLACPASSECRVYTLESDDNCVDVGVCVTNVECSATDYGSTVSCESGAGTCDGAGSCVVPDKLSLGNACTVDDECAQGNCVEGVDGTPICCDSACDGLCQGCGEDGHCDQVPADDSACPAVTCDPGDACTDYPAALTNNRCADLGACHNEATYCLPSHASAGEACGTGFECDGAGSCESICSASDVFCGDSCIDPLSSEAYCGASGDCSGSNAGDVCNANEVCENGQCLVQCGAGLVRCNNACIDPLSDQQYCGASGTCSGASAGTACSAAGQCISGTCRAWGGHVDFDAAILPELAASGTGDILASWSEYDSSALVDNAWVNVYEASLSHWDGSELIEDSLGRAWGVRVAGSPSGEFTELWFQDDPEGGPTHLWAAFRTAAGTWQSDGQVSTGTVSVSPQDARVVMTSTGDALAVWAQSASSSEDESIFWSRRTGGAWQVPGVLEQNTNECGRVELFADPVGGALAVWNCFGGTTSLVARRWNGSVWTPEVEIASNDDVLMYQSAAADAEGNYYLTWNNGAVPAVQARRYDAAADTWQSPVTFDTSGGYNTMRVGGDGTAHLIWWGTFEAQSVIFWSQYTPATGVWRTPEVMAVADPGELGVDSAGNAFLLYGDDTQASLLWRYLPSGSATWTDARRIASTTDTVFSYRLAVDPQGRALTVYNHGPGDGTSQVGYNRLQ